MESLHDSYFRYLRYFLSKDDTSATAYDKYMALAYAVRSDMVDKWIKTQNYYHNEHPRRVYFLALEYVFGKSLHPNIVNLGLMDQVAALAQEVGFSLDELYSTEDEFSLGNGGKGRLAAAFQEAMATQGIPAQGYGIRYDYAQFKQQIVNGTQVEKPYDWLHKGHPWEIVRPEYRCIVTFGGTSEPVDHLLGKRAPHVWKFAEEVVAIPSDVPVPGYRSSTVNTLRLWSARAAEEFLPDFANHGEYARACEDTAKAGRLTRVLFPEEDVIRATNARIRQQYFLISTALQDIIRRHKHFNASLLNLADAAAVQLNGTRCALAVPELMRLLVDVEKIPWDTAWQITYNLFSYTSHAMLKENLEKWPVYILEQILPRHMEIIYEINQQHLDSVRLRLGSDMRAIQELSVIEEGEVKRVKMGHLAVLGSSHINGVSETQTNGLRTRIFPHLVEHRPESVRNVTNGVTHRRWVLCSNSLLANLITDAIGEKWTLDAGYLRELEPFAEDASFRGKIGQIKEINKHRLLISLNRVIDCSFDTDALFDVQCKRIHPYKRQMLHVFNIVHRYLEIIAGNPPVQPRLHLFSGKAVPSDFLGKQIIHLIHVVAAAINADSRVNGLMKVVFVPDYSVTWAEKIIPAADIGEELATPFLEACSTTIFKYSFNGALLVASRGGSNDEIARCLGDDTTFIFGAAGTGNGENPGSAYSPYDLIERSPTIKQIFEFLEMTLVSTLGGEAVYPLISTLRDSDRYRVLPDVEDYFTVQDRIDSQYASRDVWLAKVVRALSRVGYYSCDRAVDEFARTIWKVQHNPT